MKCAKINSTSKASFFPDDNLPAGWIEIDISDFTDYGELVQGYSVGKYIVVNNKMRLNPEYDRIALAKAKEAKYTENDEKASEARYNQEFTVIIQDKECVFDTKRETQSDLLTAFAVCSTGVTYDGWVTNNGVEIDLTLEDVAMISAVFKEKSNVYGLWNEYKELIDNAATAEEVEEITIRY